MKLYVKKVLSEADVETHRKFFEKLKVSAFLVAFG